MKLGKENINYCFRMPFVLTDLGLGCRINAGTHHLLGTYEVLTLTFSIEAISCVFILVRICKRLFVCR